MIGPLRCGPTEEIVMRIVAAATVLFLSFSLVPSFAQNAENAPAPSQPQSTPVQPERPPQQSEQAREQDQKRSEDVRVGRDWKAQQRNELSDHATGRGPYDRDDRTGDRNLRMERGDRRDRGDGGWHRHHYYRDSDSDFDDDRGRRRVKTCVEYENGDEYCRYRYTRDR